jgi:hypothetical protein
MYILLQPLLLLPSSIAEQHPLPSMASSSSARGGSSQPGRWRAAAARGRGARGLGGGEQKQHVAWAVRGALSRRGAHDRGSRGPERRATAAARRVAV